MKFEKPIYVTKATVQPLEIYQQELLDVWQSGIFTHTGPKVQLFEKRIDEYLKSDQTVAVTNGTIAIQLALRALDITGGEVITTPFSWIATCSALQWERCTPVFVDIKPDTFNIDPANIEAAITKNTRAILGVHVFSNPCQVEEIRAIADRHNLAVIYDGAHAFGVTHRNRSVLDFGDVATTSFHATKLLNSGEGGAVFAQGALKERLRSLRFFGHDEQKNIIDTGCNGKMTELHAALGLINLKLVPQIIAKRKEIYTQYSSMLGDRVGYQHFSPDSYNYAYMPVVLRDESEALNVIAALNRANVFPRRYFYPSLNEVKSVKQYTPCPISESISRRILALPSYHALPSESIDVICRIILSALET
ncbi:MAG: DegT/DnrJ/EryC1/StrS family aminotransferase [Myxococcota bacterium]|nr:DegT/DnrJ/EryC1/StrS family aminotransferase [Myxococcota bacterium]